MFTFKLTCNNTHIGNKLRVTQQEPMNKTTASLCGRLQQVKNHLLPVRTQMNVT